MKILIHFYDNSPITHMTTWPKILARNLHSKSMPESVSIRLQKKSTTKHRIHRRPDRGTFTTLFPFWPVEASSARLVPSSSQPPALVSPRSACITVSRVSYPKASRPSNLFGCLELSKCRGQVVSGLTLMQPNTTSHDDDYNDDEKT